MNLFTRTSPRDKKSNLYYITLVGLLCLGSYLLGIWRTSSVIPRAAFDYSTGPPCEKFSKTISTRDLDFNPHHNPRDPPPVPSTAASFPSCSARLSEHTPCEDAKRSLKFPRERLEYRQRHCPERDEALKCRIPAPYGYKTTFRWPESRDVAWFANVPHTELTVEKKNQNWVRYENDRFWFPGGGTMFPRGADAYIDDIGRLIDLSDGSIRTAIDTGCGVASFGAYLLSRNITTMSFAPRDTHEAQVQFALERGVPAMIGIMATIRLPYPSRAFDLAHCSRCLIPWGQNDGVYLMEVDRVLRPGGYWILSGPPINWQKRWKGWERTMDDLNAEQTQIEQVARSLCWKKVVQRDDLAIWQKPLNHIHCKKTRQVLKKPEFCRHDQDPDMAWYTKMDSCLTPLPEVDEAEDLKTVAGGKVEKWPARLNAVPPRVNNGDLKDITPEGFLEDTELWKKRVSYYKKLDYQLGETGRYRNVLDMNAYVGGFAAALADEPVWVMNVVPVEAKVNTLGVIYERGLIGTYQNWCEAMSTYPRTYDFIHADSVFTLYQDKCEPEDILLEMDRILRPGGGVIIRDDVDVLIKVKELTKGLQWEGRIADHEKSPHERVKIYYAVKQYWTVTAPEEEDKNPISHHRVCSDTVKMYPVSSSSSSSPATNDVSTPLLNRNRPRSSQPLRGAASRLLRRASSRGMMLRESSVRVRETAAEQIEERQSEWAYSKPVIVLDLVWNLAFVFVTVGVLWFSSGEEPRVPLRCWIVVYNLQCLLHVGCVISEYRRRHGYDNLNRDSDSGLTSSEDESDGPEIESGTSLAKHLESTNAIFSFVWWIIGFYWISAGSEELARSSTQLYWLCVAFLAFDVIFLVLCVAVASLIAIAVCCCLPCIIAVLYALAEQEGASDEEIERLPRFKFLTVRNSEKVNGEILETHGGIMTQLGVDSPSERVLSSDEAECCVCLCDYEDGTKLRELWCRHHFHEACIDKWLRINATCPLCKSNVLKTDEQSGNDAV
ncbi:hypothetical protein Bca101_080297 [Brassica carinata]